jgi:hypothetical protein
LVQRPEAGDRADFAVAGGRGRGGVKLAGGSPSPFGCCAIARGASLSCARHLGESHARPPAR